MVDIEETYNGNMSQNLVQSEGSLRFRFSQDMILARLENQLNGTVVQYEYDEETGKTKENVIRISAPLMTQEGIKTIISIVDCHLNPISTQSYIAKEDLRYENADCRQVLLDALFYNEEKWNIDISKFGLIIDESMLFIRRGLSHARNGNTMSLLSQSTQSVEKIQSETKGGMLSLFSGGNKR